MTALQHMVMAQEGLRLKPYTDSLGNWTIGVGRNLDEKGVSEDEAMMLLNNDLADAIDDVRHVCSVYDELSEPRKQVLVSMAFNMGRTRLEGFVRFLGAIHRGDWDDAADEMLDSQWAKEVGARATTLSRMMRNNVEWV